MIEWLDNMHGVTIKIKICVLTSVKWKTSMWSFKENPSGFFPWDLPVVKMSPEWVTGPEQGKFSVGLLPLASGPACLGMAFPPFLVKQLYRCDSVVISSFVRTGYTTRRWRWLLGRTGYSVGQAIVLHITTPYTLLDTWDRNGPTSGPTPWKIDYYYYYYENKR